MNYLIGEDQAGRFIQCLLCGARSYHPKDIEHRYCGHCHRFLD